MSIAIIGGGPVGLTVAIRLINNSHYMEKDVPKDTTIHIYEKREKYTRTQYIVTGGTKGDILQNYPYQLRDELRENFMCYIDNQIPTIRKTLIIVPVTLFYWYIIVKYLRPLYS